MVINLILESENEIPEKTEELKKLMEEQKVKSGCLWINKSNRGDLLLRITNENN